MGGHLPGYHFCRAMVNENINEQGIIFILGIMPRSGTHFLWNLLCQHPDCEKSAIPEDGLVSKADFLARYVNRNYQVWKSEDDLPDIPVRSLLTESLGEGLMLFLRRARKELDKLNKEQPPKKAQWLVTKFPRVTNIDKFFSLFPRQKLLILVRDGRALAESLHTSFRYGREAAIRDWTEAARRIMAFERTCKKDGQYLVVRYEALHANTEQEMRRVLAFLELDADNYDFNAALNLPVVGSSVFKRGKGSVHWEPVSKTEEFNPLARAAGWTRRRHERFNWLAKDALLYFGYQPQEFRGNRWIWVVWNRLLDTRHEAGIWLGKIPRLLRFIRQRLRIYLKSK